MVAVLPGRPVSAAARAPSAPAPAALVVWATLVVTALVVGTWWVDGDAVQLRAAPLYGRWDWHPGVGLLPAIAVGGAVVWWGPALASRCRWRTVPLLAGAWGSLWALALAASDGWSAVTAPLASRHEYEPFAAGIDDLGPFLGTYVERLAERPIHVQGHPPGPTVLAWLLDRAGLGGAGWLALLVLAAWGIALAATLVAARLVAGEPAARRAAPALTLLPAAVWAGTSLDALFAALIATSTTLLLTATTPRPSPSPATAPRGSLPLAGGAGVVAAVPESLGSSPPPATTSPGSAPLAGGAGVVAGVPESLGSSPPPAAVSQGSVALAGGAGVVAGVPGSLGSSPPSATTSPGSAPLAGGAGVVTGVPESLESSPAPAAAGVTVSLGSVPVAGVPGSPESSPSPAAVSRGSVPLAGGGGVLGGVPGSLELSPSPAAVSRGLVPLAGGGGVAAGVPGSLESSPSPASASRGSVPRAAGAGVVAGVALLFSYGAAASLLVGVFVVGVLRCPGRVWVAVAGGVGGTLLAAAAVGFWWPGGLAATGDRYWDGIAAERPAVYLTLLGNPAVLALATGPAVAVGLWKLRGRAALLPYAALVAVAAADLSQMSRGEVERIWLPFVPFLALAAPGRRRGWLAAQAGVALAVQSTLISAW